MKTLLTLFFSLPNDWKILLFSVLNYTLNKAGQNLNIKSSNYKRNLRGRPYFYF
jgi:hypothetical protein